MDKIVYPLTEEGIFTLVFKLGPVPFRVICEDGLQISADGEGAFDTVAPNGMPIRHPAKWRKVAAFLRKLRHNGLVEHCVASKKPRTLAGWAATEPVRDSSIIVDTMLLTSVENVPAEATVDTWSPWERAQVLMWTWASMLRASDNAYVRVPPMPAVLKPFKGSA